MDKLINSFKKLCRACRENYFVLFDSLLLNRQKPTPDNSLFIDCGANKGQAFQFFSKRFPVESYSYQLVEPNPACIPLLDEYAKKSHNVLVIEKAASTQSGETTLFGTGPDREFSQTATLKKLNGKYYQENPIQIILMDFGQHLESMKERYSTVVIKMDIEGEEYDVLESILEQNLASMINILYVEFHPGKGENSTLERQEKIVAQLKNSGVKVRIWH